MISYFPEIYPDELVYSWFCRYYVHSGCITHKTALNDLLFKRCNNPSKEFIGHLKPDADRIIKQIYPIEKLIINHTMYPQYARFISLEQKKNALFHIGYDFCDAHHLFCILPRSKTDSFLKYCPVCANEDRRIFGEAYWHRVHQIRNISICAKHKCRLIYSDVSAKSERAYTLCPAEFHIVNTNVEYAKNKQQVYYSEYLSSVFNAPVDFDNDTPISAILYHAMSKTDYMKKTGRSRYTKRLADDIQAFYQSMGVTGIASIYQIQRVLLGERFDFSVVCQVAFYLNMSVEELTKSKITRRQIQKETDSHYMKNKEPIDWKSYDDEYAPLLEQVAHSIYTGTFSEKGRPKRVSERIVYRELDLPAHRLDNLPKCKAVFDKYAESYPENWARRIVWAFCKLQSERKDKPFYWSDIREISGVKKKKFDLVIPYLYLHTDRRTADSIVSLCREKKPPQ